MNELPPLPKSEATPWHPFKYTDQQMHAYAAAAVAAYRRDAERYRYYRARAYVDGAFLALDVGVIDDVAIGDFSEFIDATADAAIAAAMATQSK
jgi:hypothetical protein